MAVETAVMSSGPSARSGLRRRGGRRAAARALAGLLTGALLACGGVADNNKLPPTVQDPTTVQNPAGALKRYRATLGLLRSAVERAITVGAVLTDEMAALPMPLQQSGFFTALDSRQNIGGPISQLPYDTLHMLRGQAREARGFLASYAPDSSPALQAHLYAVEGYADVFLADLFCSGMPLSTVDFNGDYTLAAGSTTAEVYEHAVALFDSALSLASDSASFVHLAALGRGRALLALGRYAEAAAAVAGVPDTYVYQLTVPPAYADPELPILPGLVAFGQYYGSVPGVPGVADREGGNGLDYRSSGDPRIAPVLLGSGPSGGEMYYPDPSRFSLTGPVVYTLANGVEARLIEAEAALQASPSDGQWLVELNALRTDGTYDTQPNASDPSQTDTLWHAGTGGVAGLRPLADPIDPAARVDLVFRERAFWLYLTGHRQGDLRRLIRRPEYGRAPTSVYPTGFYGGGNGSYGTELTLPVPESEVQLNPKYTGCFHRNA